MTDSKVTPDALVSQARYEITVEVQPVNNSSNSIKVHADGTIALAPDGFVKICGFSVLDSSDKSLRILPPARKGKHRYLDIVSLSGRFDKWWMPGLERNRGALTPAILPHPTQTTPRKFSMDPAETEVRQRWRAPRQGISRMQSHPRNDG